LTEDILHLVLARLPGAPTGSRGVSLFLVPKRLDHAHANAVRCDGIEHKMGIKGSATCSLVFDGAQGWLIGEANRGLAAMFVMMNSARLHVALQGLGHAESAWQNAYAYGLERKQMRAPNRPVGVAAEAVDPIHYHPAMRRVLLELQAYAEGMRAVGYWAAHLLDQAEHAPDLATRQGALQLAELLTPVIKAFFTEQGFRLSSNALQVFGGYGYVTEFAIEQTLRDSRIAMIYEGSNEIQANDLLLRKVLGDEGRAFGQLLAVMREEAGQTCETASFCAELVLLCNKLECLQIEIRDLAVEEGEYPYRVAGDFLRLCGVALLAYSWSRAARVSRLLPDSDPLRASKLETAGFFFAYLLPEADYRIAAIRAAKAPLPFLR
jgi:hypothetical protein